MAAFVHVSNALGTINPAKEMIATLKSKNIPVLLDGAQAVAHQAVDVQDLDCDLYVFSSHKLFGRMESEFSMDEKNYSKKCRLTKAVET